MDDDESNQAGESSEALEAEFVSIKLLTNIYWSIFPIYFSNHYIYVYMYGSWEVRQLLAEGGRFPPGTPVSPANKTDRHDMTLDVESGVKHQSI